jgi:ABC-2 type transport system permease protein
MAEPKDRGAARRVLAVALREFRHTVLTKGFIFGALVMPVIMFVAFAAIGMLMDSKLPPTVGTVAVLDASGTVERHAREELAPERVNAVEFDGKRMKELKLPAPPPGTAQPLVPRIDLTLEFPRDPAQEQALRDRIRDGGLLALAIVPPEVLATDPRLPDGSTASFTLVVPSGSPPRLTSLLDRSVAKAIVKARVERAGSDWSSLDALLSEPGTSVRRLSKDGTESAESVIAKTLLPMGFMLLIWVATFTSGNYLLTTTIEEKSSKVMEVVLSAVSPMQLLTGKILGFAAVSVLMVGMYGALGVAGLAFAAMGDLVSPGLLVLMGVYFVMAYAFVAIMMASVGSAVNDLREAQSLVTPAMLVLTVPLMLWLPISEQPNGTLARDPVRDGAARGGLQRTDRRLAGGREHRLGLRVGRRVPVGRREGVPGRRPDAGQAADAPRAPEVDPHGLTRPRRGRRTRRVGRTVAAWLARSR